MSVAGAIRAGAAYVEVFLDQNRLTAGLASVQSKLRSWSAGLGRMGGSVLGGGLPGPLGAIAQFATSPAGMLSGLLLASRQAATFGTELDILSQKTGVAHEILGGLEYAAKQSGVSVQALGVGIRQLAKNSYDASRGLREQKDAFAALGVDVRQLSRLSPDEQLKIMADKLRAIENPTLRAALAMKVFGRSGVDLLPLLLEGSGGIDALMQKADELGLTMGGSEAKGLREFGDRVEDMWLAAKRAAVSIGSALAPELRGAAVWMAKAAKTAKDWIEDHKGLVVAALRVTGAIVAGGLAMSLLGKALGLAAGGVGLLIVPFRVLSGLAGTVGSVLAGAFSAVLGVLSAVGSVLSFLMTPVGLLTAAVVGLAGYFLWSTGAIGGAVDWLKGALGGLLDDAKKAFGGIADALAAGDIALAAKVLWALLKLEWQKGLAFLEGLWEGFKGFWSDAVLGLAMVFNNLVAKIKTIWAELIGWISKKWEAFKVSGFTETLASWLAPIFAKIEGVSVEDTEKALREDFARGRAKRPQREAQIDAETNARAAEIEKDRQATEDQLAADKLRGDKARQARIDAAQADVAAARQELDDAVAQARAARDTAAAGTTKAPMPALETPEIPEIGNLAAVKSSVSGTFGAAALWGMGGSSMERDIADMNQQTKQLAENAEKQVILLGRIEESLAEGGVAVA